MKGIHNQWETDCSHFKPKNFELDLTLDTSAANQALQDLQFIELKGKTTMTTACFTG
jgi:hypothetical protein